MKALSVLLFIPPFLSLGLAVNKNCYFPNGKISAEDVACNPNDDFSPCCGKQSDGTSAYCLSNGHCLVDFKLSRGSCTDQSWGSSNCAQHCANGT